MEEYYFPEQVIISSPGILTISVSNCDLQTGIGNTNLISVDVNGNVLNEISLNGKLLLNEGKHKNYLIKIIIYIFLRD